VNKENEEMCVDERDKYMKEMDDDKGGECKKIYEF